MIKVRLLNAWGEPSLEAVDRGKNVPEGPLGVVIDGKVSPLFLLTEKTAGLQFDNVYAVAESINPEGGANILDAVLNAGDEFNVVKL